MKLHTMARVAACALLAIGVTAASAHAATDSDKCASAKMKAAAKYAACRLAADSKAKSTGEAAVYTKCDDDQSKSWAKIEAKYPSGCPTSGDQASLQADLVAATSCVTEELNGPSGSCGISAAMLCGNGVVDAGEACDQSDLDGQTCATATSGVQSFGTLRCSTDCQGYDLGECITCPASGTVVDGQCWVLGNPGDSCTTACSSHFMATSTATTGVSPANANTCAWVMTKFGSSTSFITFLNAPADTGCTLTGPGGSPRIAQTSTQAGSSPGVQRACACE